MVWSWRPINIWNISNMKNECEKYSDNDLWISNKNALYYYCLNLLLFKFIVINLWKRNIIIIWYCYSNKCEKWYMKSNTKIKNWVCIGDNRCYRRPFPLQFIDQVWRILWLIFQWLMIDKVFNFIIDFLQEFYPYYMNFLHFNIYDFFLPYCLRAWKLFVNMTHWQ